jgi:hypothetical protein
VYGEYWQMSKSWPRRFLSLLVLICGGLLAIFLFSAKEASYRCEGAFEGKEVKDTVYFKLTEYRWWVLWANNDGRLNLEIPSKAAFGDLFPIKRVGD